MEQDCDTCEESCLDDLLAALEIEPPEADTPPHTRFLKMRGDLLGFFSDPERNLGMPTLAAALFQNGRAVRDYLGDDSWRVLNRLQQNNQQVLQVKSVSAARELSEQNLTLLAAFFGLCNDTMPHHHGWLFMDIGRYLERVQSTLDLLKLAFVSAIRPGVPLWEAVLATTDNMTSYVRRYRSALHPTAILDLLLFDEHNPRSIGYQVLRLQSQIDRLPHQPNTPYRSAEERLVLEAASTLQLADIERLSSLHHSGEAAQELARLLDALEQPLSHLSDALVHSHFSHAEVPRQLVRTQA
jgi:uncharacterized alpha-E superfamily protein